jgi:polysaccharide biosynthesis protein PelE
MKKKTTQPPLFEVPLIFAVNSKNWKAILLGVLLFIIEAVILYLYVEKIIPLLIFILLHLLCLALAVLLVVHSYKKGEDLRFCLLLCLALFAAGPFGVIGFLLFAALYPLLSRYAPPFNKWLTDLFPETPIPLTNVFDRIKAGWDDYKEFHEITPFHDFFRYGTHLQKQAVLDAIIHDFHPLYAPMLKEALDDPSNTVRIQAGAIMKKIDMDFETKLKQLVFEKENRLVSDKFDLKIAQLFDAYAHTGLLEPKRETEIQTNAINYYSEYLKKYPTDKDASLALGRLLFRMNKYQECIAWYEEYKKIEKVIPASASCWLLEALYKLHHYERLSHEAHDLKEEMKPEQFPSEVLETIETWGAHGS